MCPQTVHRVNTKAKQPDSMARLARTQVELRGFSVSQTTGIKAESEALERCLHQAITIVSPGKSDPDQLSKEPTQNPVGIIRHPSSKQNHASSLQTSPSKSFRFQPKINPEKSVQIIDSQPFRIQARSFLLTRY